MKVKDLAEQIVADPFILTQELKKQGYKVISPRSELEDLEVEEIKVIYQHGFSIRPERTAKVTQAQLIPVEAPAKPVQPQAAKDDSLDIIDVLYKLSTPWEQDTELAIKVAKHHLKDKKKHS